jgi:hypothetical protein
MKKLGGVDEDEKGDTIFNNEEHAVEEQRKKNYLDWISVGVMMGGIVIIYGLKGIILLQ